MINRSSPAGFRRTGICTIPTRSAPTACRTTRPSFDTTTRISCPCRTARPGRAAKTRRRTADSPARNLPRPAARPGPRLLLRSSMAHKPSRAARGARLSQVAHLLGSGTALVTMILARALSIAITAPTAPTAALAIRSPTACTTREFSSASRKWAAITTRARVTRAGRWSPTSPTARRCSSASPRSATARGMTMPTRTVEDRCLAGSTLESPASSIGSARAATRR